MQEEKSRETEWVPESSGENIQEGGVADESEASKGYYLGMFERLTEEEASKIEEEDPQWDKMYEEVNNRSKSLREGDIVKGTVYAVTDKEVILDVGFKSEGTIPLEQFDDCNEINKGDIFSVFLEKMENQDGLIVLSKEKADFIRAWDDLKQSYDTGKVVTAIADRRIKGGLVVKLMNVEAFLPGSQVALRQIPNLDELINKDLDCKIIKLNKRRRNIVVSRRVVLEEERESKKRKLIAELEVGQEREGVVKNITDFGAFVDLGGIDGLLHLTDLTWGRVSHPSEVVAIGDKLKIKVLDFDRERERISLGLKQLTPYPWEGVEERYPIGKKMRGKVVSITDYGAFVELEKGIEGLIHISEMSWTRHVKHPSKVVAIGDTVEAIILNIDKEHEKISLGLKQLEPDPWKALESKYPPGTRLKGKVRNLTNFGAFVEIEDGIDGLVHISDMSWAKRVRHPSEMVKKSDEVEVVVLEIDSGKRRISLGMKQMRENPWNELASEFTINTEAKGRITRLLDRGAVVELKEDVEGFVPLSHLGVEGLKKPSDYFEIDMEIPLKVIKMDPQNKRIVLSVAASFEGKIREEAADIKSQMGEKAGEESRVEDRVDSDVEGEGVEPAAEEEPAENQIERAEEPVEDDARPAAEGSEDEPAAEPAVDVDSGEGMQEGEVEEKPPVEVEAAEEKEKGEGEEEKCEDEPRPETD